MARSSRSRQGRFLGLPYDWRKPTRERVRHELWDTDNPRFLVPKAYGWGLGFNLGAFWARWKRRSG